MKLVTAINKSFKMDDVRFLLSDINVQGYCDRSKRLRSSKRSHRALSRSGIRSRFLVKIKFEIAEPGDGLDDIVDAIIGWVSSAKVGDGKLKVSDLEQCVRIRTGETGPEAI